MRKALIVLMVIILASCNTTPKKEIAKDATKIVTEWGYIDATGKMYLTLPHDNQQAAKDTIAFLYNINGRLTSVDSLVNLKSFMPLTSIPEYSATIKDKRKLELEFFRFFTDNIRVFHWDYNKKLKTKTLEEFCFLEEMKFIDYCYFIVDENVYCGNVKIESADVATFRTFLTAENKSQWLTTLARDTNHIYEGNTVLTKKRAREKYFMYADSLQHLLK